MSSCHGDLSDVLPLCLVVTKYVDIIDIIFMFLHKVEGILPTPLLFSSPTCPDDYHLLNLLSSNYGGTTLAAASAISVNIDPRLHDTYVHKDWSQLWNLI